MAQMCVELLNSVTRTVAAIIWLFERNLNRCFTSGGKQKNLSSSQHLWISSLVVKSFNGTILCDLVLRGTDVQFSRI